MIDAKETRLIQVHRVDNGWIVYPERRGDYQGLADALVFRDPAELGRFVENWAKGVTIHWLDHSACEKTGT